jgi:Putative peptidoglycan binding domain
MSSATRDQTTDAQPPAPGNRRRPGRRRWWALAAGGLGAVLVAAGTVVVAARPSGGHAARTASGTATSLAAVTRQTLTAQSSVDGTLGYAGSYTVAGHLPGTITWLPAPGRVIRQGQVLYRFGNGSPVFLLYGPVPDWRAMSKGLRGQDVRQLNRDLVALGYATRSELDPGSKYFSAETADALKRLQAHLGLPRTGSLRLGHVVFLPTAIRVKTVPAGLGSPATGTVLTATSDRQVVTISLSAAQQTQVKAGDRVGITLPAGAVTPGRVSSVGKVATTDSSGKATITVLVRLLHPRAAAGLNQAPVTVAITTATVNNALVVSVSALMARSAGGYAVEEVTAGGRHHLVPVTLGLFDDAAGLVQVSGAGLAAGQRVVVPAP